jgi:hypothetical protein
VSLFSPWINYFWRKTLYRRGGEELPPMSSWVHLGLGKMTNKDPDEDPDPGLYCEFNNNILR